MTERDQALVELAECKRDKERLDWWFAQTRVLYWRTPMNGHGWRLLASTGDHLAEGNTQRDAIDAAMKGKE